MLTLETRVEVTPIGHYVSRLTRADRRLGGWTFPGLHSSDPRLRAIALETYETVSALRGAIRDELARFGGLPLGPAQTSDDADPAAFSAPTWTPRELAAAPGPNCPTCRDTGLVETGWGNAHEGTAICPDCGPVYEH